MSEDRPARLWRDYVAIPARQSLPRTEIVQGIFARLPELGNLSGERREPRTGRCGALGEASVGRGKGRLPSAGRNLDDRGSEMAEGPKKEVTELTACAVVCDVAKHSRVGAYGPPIYIRFTHALL